MGEREAGICPDGHMFFIFIFILFLWYLPLEIRDWEVVKFWVLRPANAGGGVRSGCVETGGGFRLGSVLMELTNHEDRKGLTKRDPEVVVLGFCLFSLCFYVSTLHLTTSHSFYY